MLFKDVVDEEDLIEDDDDEVGDEGGESMCEVVGERGESILDNRYWFCRIMFIVLFVNEWQRLKVAWQLVQSGRRR